ncbi:Spore coat protein CotO [Halobacillus dabanensis]|uniref:Spore coat protein CotO n=1 Tax=Halobacillus dabanensis TaxID=240302 RepID=A0A1I3T570_HALDA|nr:CotO family spore coat protein [Halobacillus dabanensis]SFJ66288.1 Spore coat protein CotO [Halobacillus dabanensis]
MAEEKRLAKQPMLYIVQPKNLKPAEVPMQTSFRSQRSPSSDLDSGSEQTTKEVTADEKEMRMRRNNAPHQEELAKLKSEASASADNRSEELQETEKEEKQKKRTTPRDRRQRFHDMSLEEKVNYFFNLSPHVPKMKCEVVTEEEQYRGYITDYVDGYVHMKVFQRPFQREVAFDSIKDIRLLGF